MDDALNDEDDEWGTDPHTRKRLLQARKRCEKKLIEECVEHFRVSSGSETTGHSGGVEINARDFFGASYDGDESVTWGGSKGFAEACMDLSNQVSNECVAEYRTCGRNASPKMSCSFKQGRR